MLAALEAGCSAPVGAYAAGTAEHCTWKRRSSRRTGGGRCRESGAAAPGAAGQLGRDVAAELLRRGAGSSHYRAPGTDEQRERCLVNPTPSFFHAARRRAGAGHRRLGSPGGRGARRRGPADAARRRSSRPGQPGGRAARPGPRNPPAAALRRELFVAADAPAPRSLTWSRSPRPASSSSGSTTAIPCSTAAPRTRAACAKPARSSRSCPVLPPATAVPAYAGIPLGADGRRGPHHPRLGGEPRRVQPGDARGPRRGGRPGRHRQDARRRGLDRDDAVRRYLGRDDDRAADGRLGPGRASRPI